MKVIYISLTGQTRKFINKLEMEGIELSSKGVFSIKEPYIVIVPSYHNEVTEIINNFIEFEDNIKYLKGVCGSGNRNFNTLFCFSAKEISEKYNVPLIHCFEFQGSDYDIEIVKERVSELG